MAIARSVRESTSQTKPFFRHSSSKGETIEVIPLLRAGGLVSSLAGAFGQGLRETRLTALLGYLIAADPSRWMTILGFHGEAQSILIENHHASGRSDIEIHTAAGVGIIEAKIDATNPLKQSLGYQAKWRVLLTQYVPTDAQRRIRGIRFIQWRALLPVLIPCARSSDTTIRFVARDLITYLEEHRMIKTREPVEIYAREINNEETLNFFLRGRMYGCDLQKNSRLPEAMYFAPHFAQKIANSHPGVHVGVSYIAKIEAVEVITTWKELLEACRSLRGKAWVRRHMHILEPVHRLFKWDGKGQRSFLFLGEPRLVFAPSVRKEKLQKGRGFLSKRFFSFDQFYDAWSR